MSSGKKHLGEKRSEGGFTVSLELIFIATCILCVVIIAWASLGAKLVAEFADVGSAVGSLNQSYRITAVAVFHPNDPGHPTNVATWAGSTFVDAPDFCDLSCTCGVIVCIPPTPGPDGHGEPPPI